jgi:hypothetical protein
MISVISFDEPYGDIGLTASSSEIGTCAGLPYTAAVEEKINTCTPPATAHSISARGLATLFL